MKEKILKSKWNFVLLIVILYAASVVGCNNGPKTDQGGSKMSLKSKLLDIETNKALETLANCQVLFAHHSLGGNILEGLEVIFKELSVNAEGVITAYKQSISRDSALVHVKPGKNKDPNSKVDGFAKAIHGLDSFTPQVASMEFCFVDFNPYTDVDQVFNYCKESIDTLKKERPGNVYV